MLVFLLPLLILLCLFYTEITWGITKFVQYVLKDYIPVEQIQIGKKEFLPYLGGVYYVKIPSISPDLRFAVINFLAVLCISIFFLTGKRKGKPISIYLLMASLTHMLSCLFFIFVPERFPYTASQYSELYIKQEVSIWIFFLIISGLITGVLGFKGFIRRMLMVIMIMVYSFIFGILRYIFFMFIIYRFTSLYMATLFFVLGPLFDFLYFVYFYGIYIDRSIQRYDSNKGRGQWRWA